MVSKASRWLDRVSKWLIELSRGRKKALMLVSDGLCIPMAMWCAVTLRVGVLQRDIWSDRWLYACALLVGIPLFIRIGLYRAVIRYMGPKALSTIFSSVSASAALLMAFNETGLWSRLPVSVLVMYWALTVLYMAGSRFAVRMLVNHRRRVGTERVAIYGAGFSGIELVRSMRIFGKFNPIAFVDDSPALQGRLVEGLEVFASSHLPELVRDEAVTTVLLALPSQTRSRRRQILKQLEGLGVHIQTVPDLGDILSGTASVTDVRDVDANDLLERDPVAPNAQLLGACITDKAVMVTGAGGSIGSELCRQILALRPHKLVLLEMSEVSLYLIDKELRLLASGMDARVEIVPLLGNAHHRQRIREVMAVYGIQTVYHAAAYKHVPLVEHNIVEGIHNNIFSTLHAAEAAAECKVETFVLVSTDKAVNPTNVMGATKRFAEIILQALQERSTDTRFCMVRFGNVLESSGSVVPLFREQIKRGGPVTVTHPEVIRYFMTIPEAAQLVIQAGSMAKGGDVFVLDMGKPVRIQDLAKRMIGLMGLTVRDDAHNDGDIEIVYTGLRPGEKLYEELLIGSNVFGTEHPMIMRANEHHPDWNAVSVMLLELLENVNRFDCGKARDILMRAVVEYQPSEEIRDFIWSMGKKLASVNESKISILSEHRRR